MVQPMLPQKGELPRLLPVSQVVSILHAPYKHFTWAFMLILCIRVCLSSSSRGAGHMSLAPVSTVPGQGWGKTTQPSSKHFCCWLQQSMAMCSPDKLTSCQLVTDFTSKLLFDWPLDWAEGDTVLFHLSLCWIVPHLHSLNEETVRTCALMDNQRNCFSSSKIHGQNWSLGVLIGLFSKRESYKSRGCRIML